MDLPVVIIDDALDWLIVAVSGVVGAGWDVVRLVLSGLLRGSGGLDAVQVLLIEPTVVVDAVLPPFLLEAEVIVEDVLARRHLALHPLRLVVAALSPTEDTLG